MRLHDTVRRRGDVSLRVVLRVSSLQGSNGLFHFFLRRADWSGRIEASTPSSVIGAENDPRGALKGVGSFRGFCGERRPVARGVVCSRTAARFERRRGS